MCSIQLLHRVFVGRVFGASECGNESSDFIKRMSECSCYFGIWLGELSDRDHLGQPRCKWEEDIGWVSKKWDGKAGTGFIWHSTGKVGWCL
jgi:hypothetical protein